MINLHEDSENHPQVRSFNQVFVFCLLPSPRGLFRSSVTTSCPGGSVGRGVQPVASTRAFDAPVSLAGDGIPIPRSRPMLHIALARQLEAAKTNIDLRIAPGCISRREFRQIFFVWSRLGQPRPIQLVETLVWGERARNSLDDVESSLQDERSLDEEQQAAQPHFSAVTNADQHSGREEISEDRVKSRVLFWGCGALTPFRPNLSGHNQWAHLLPAGGGTRQQWLQVPRGRSANTMPAPL